MDLYLGDFQMATTGYQKCLTTCTNERCVKQYGLGFRGFCDAYKGIGTDDNPPIAIIGR